MTDHALRLDGLTVATTAGAAIVRDVSFELSRGEVLALVGESGCGKTTTGLALLGHSRPGTRIVEGEVWVEGVDLLTLEPKRLRSLRGSAISYVPQDPSASLNPRHRVGSQVREILRLHGEGARSAGKIGTDLFERVGLASDREFTRRYPFELSGGQQQRVAIAMALACKPAVIVLDEPTTGLDVSTEARIVALIGELASTVGSAFLYVTHDLAVVEAIADRVAVMYAGELVEVGPREPLLREPTHPYTSLLISAVPRLSSRAKLVGIPGSTPAPGAHANGCAFAPRCPIAIPMCGERRPSLAPIAPERSVRCWKPAQLAISPGNHHGPESEGGLPEVGAISVLEVTGLSASYGRGSGRSPVLHDVSLSLATGECVALVGESGSGKSTLGRCIVGLHEFEDGTIQLNGRSLAGSARERDREDRQAIQLVFQNPDRSLNPRQTVDQIVARPARLFRLVDRGSQKAFVADLLDRVRLPRSAAIKYPHELSGGEKQRVAIARALAAKPHLLVSDEITSSLDVSIQAVIISLLEELRQDGLALLFITHNLALVNSIADRTLVIHEGSLLEAGPTQSVISNPSQDHTRELLAAARDFGSR